MVVRLNVSRRQSWPHTRRDSLVKSSQPRSEHTLIVMTISVGQKPKKCFRIDEDGVVGGDGLFAFPHCSERSRPMAKESRTGAMGIEDGRSVLGLARRRRVREFGRSLLRRLTTCPRNLKMLLRSLRPHNIANPELLRGFIR